MPVYTKNNITIYYAHIPKTGGTSINCLFADLDFERDFYGAHGYECQLHHMHTNDERYLYLLSTYDISYKFTIIRNPIDRLISEFAWEYKNNTSSFMDTPFIQDITNSDFKKWLFKSIENYKKDNYYCENHFRPQIEYITNDMDLFLFGNWYNILQVLNNKIPINIKNFPHVQKSLELNIDIDSDSYELICSVYKSDIELYNNLKNNKKWIN